MDGSTRALDGRQPAAPGPRSRRLALGALCLGLFMIILDGTIVSVALPAIRADLGFSESGTAWVVNAYLLPLGGLLLLAGRAGDLLGRRRVLLVGLALFVLGSLGCGLAWEPVTLVVARFVQGVGGALGSAGVLGMIVALFPEPAERARAMGGYAFVGAAGASTGLLAGGVLTGTVGWPWIFWVNLPIGLLAMLLIRRVVPVDGPRPTGGRLDVVGGLLVTGGLVAAVWAVVDTGDPVPRVGAGLLAGVLLAVFAVRGHRVPAPLLPPGVLGRPSVAWGNLAQLLTVAGMLGFQFVVALYLQGALGYPPAATGLALVPIPLVIALVSLLLAGRLIARYGARPVLLAGQAALVVGLLLLTRPPTGDYAVDVLPSLLVLGVGAGLALPAVTTAIMSGAGPADAGLVSGLAGAGQQIGGALGVAVLAALAAAHGQGLVAAGTPVVAALAAGQRLAFAAAAGLVLVGLLVTVLRLPATGRAEPAGR